MSNLYYFYWKTYWVKGNNFINGDDENNLLVITNNNV